MIINFDNSYSKLPDIFFERIKPVPVKNPELIRLNKPLGEKLGLNLSEDESLLSAIFSGNKIPKGSEPIALLYAGHQFGYFVPQLGDGRAILLGETTFGKGSVQSIIPLKNKGAIRLTISKYYLPSGKSISEVGVVPDIKVEEEEDEEFSINTSTDNQLNYAIKLLNG